MSEPGTSEQEPSVQGDSPPGRTDEDAGEGTQSSHRMLGFSDALLSIIATVMILPVTHTEISPEQQFDRSMQRLLATRIAVYLMTFLIVTGAWAAHTRLFQVVGKIDDTLALLNLACMMTITFLPYTSYLLMASVVFLPYVSKAASWCKDRLMGRTEPTAHPVELITLDLHEPLSKERVEAFSDGVYAIVATLLILDICADSVPDPKAVASDFGGSLLAALGARGPRFLAYFGSFATVGLLWFTHHSLFLHVRKATGAMGLLNALSLAFVGGLPLAYQQTSAFARQPRDELERVRLSCAIIFLASIFQVAIWTAALLREAETLRPAVRFGGPEHTFMLAKLALYPCTSLLAFAATCLLSRFSTFIFHLTQIAVPCGFLLLRLLLRLALAGLRGLRGLRGLARPQRGPLGGADANADMQSPLLPAPC
ncbi:endosomal/lysosomal proton channel TMEM175 isoform X8 [Oryctolagus cuniculus]|uniref:endosomal/lysosomal proton channel TMEM175 isoform X8 n=1 Tax=Oryctolagus cuniculus TaxID=9986 RepID=UPI003878FD7B